MAPCKLHLHPVHFRDGAAPVHADYGKEDGNEEQDDVELSREAPEAGEKALLPQAGRVRPVKARAGGSVVAGPGFAGCSKTPCEGCQQEAGVPDKGKREEEDQAGAEDGEQDEDEGRRLGKDGAVQKPALEESPCGRKEGCQGEKDLGQGMDARRQDGAQQDVAEGREGHEVEAHAVRASGSGRSGERAPPRQGRAGAPRRNGARRMDGRTGASRGWRRLRSPPARPWAGWRRRRRSGPGRARQSSWRRFR